MPRASFYTFVTRESRNERYNIRQTTFPDGFSRFLKAISRMFTTSMRVCARLRAPVQRSTTGSASSILRSGLTWRTSCSRILLPAIPGNSIPGNDFTPRVTRFYAKISRARFRSLVSPKPHGDIAARDSIIFAMGK